MFEKLSFSILLNLSFQVNIHDLYSAAIETVDRAIVSRSIGYLAEYFFMICLVAEPAERFGVNED